MPEVSIILKDLNVILTRPLQQNYSLAEKIRHSRGNVTLFPCIEIVDIENNVVLAKALQQIHDYSIAIFASQNAVHRVMPLWPQNTVIKIVAIGIATAAALNQYTSQVIDLPSQGFSSEDLLSIPLLQEVKAKRVLIFSGEGGRDLLADELQRRGALVTKIAVYQRVLANPSLQVLSPFLNQALKRIIISMSGESLTNLHLILKQSAFYSLLHQMPLLVISKRMFDQALQLQHRPTKILLAKNASEEAILDKLIAWYAN